MKAAAPIQILGAGLTGMSAAYHLGGDFDLHEQRSTPGGHCITREEQGYRFDVTGHLLHLRDTDMRAWVQRLIGDQCLSLERKSRIFSHGVYTRYPYQANTYGLPKDIAYECVMGFLKAREQASSAAPPKNFLEFSLQVFGEGFTKHFMRPYNEKIWGVPATEITAEWCSRFVPQPKLDDVIAGALGINDHELGYNTHFLYPRRGIQALTDAVVGSLPKPIRFSRNLKAVDYKRKQLSFDDGSIPYQALISTAPLDRLVALLVDVPSEVTAAATRLRCNPLNYIDVALNVPSGIDLHWVYVPEQRYPFYRVGCYSNFSAEMAPAGRAGLYVELASRQQLKLEDVMPQVMSGLIDMGIIKKPEDIAFARLRRIEHAYVVFDHAYYDALATIMPFLEEHNIISHGRYGAWNYSAMEDALLYGREAAQRAQDTLR